MRINIRQDSMFEHIQNSKLNVTFSFLFVAAFSHYN